jgi:FkbM family methyltransferase
MNNLENQDWYVVLKKAIKNRLSETGVIFKFLNLISGFFESDDKLFAFKEILLAFKYGQTGLNRQQYTSFMRISNFLQGQAVDVVDVGANSGWFVRISQRFFNIRNVYAYEPLLRYNAFLEPLVAKIPTLKIRNFLLGSVVGEKTFYHYVDGGNSSTHKYHPDFVAPIHCRNELLEAPVLPETRLEDDLKMLETDKSLPLLLKIDAQGSELEVLKGARSLFAEGRVIAVLIEMQCQAVYEDQVLWMELLKYFESFGLVLLDVWPIQRRPDQTVTELDGIFVKRSALPNALGMAG